jgi:zinc protease
MARRDKMHFPLRAVFLALTLLASHAASAAEERVNQRLYLVRDKPGSPAQFHMIVGAGCTDEKYGECRGLAHYLEHLVLVGRNPEHKEIALRFFPDAVSNGWTSQRATVFLHKVPAREEGPRADLEKLFAFYAARLKDFSISAEDAERERNVVRQEHDWRVASRPFSRLARKLDRTLIPDHPAGQWVIGTPEDIDKFTLDDARAFHRSWYAINNVNFVVLGDIDPATLKDIADRALVGLSPRPLPLRDFAGQPAFVVERKDIVEEDATIRQAGVYFKKLMRIEEGDVLATGAVRTLVTNFLASRLPGSLYDVLADKGSLVAGAPSVTFARVAPKSFTLTIGASVAEGVAPERLLAAITAYVEELAAVGISVDTIERLKTRFAEARATADKDPRQVYSRLVGWIAGRNSYESLARWPQRIAAVTPEQVAAMLKGFSAPGRIVTGTLVPPKEAAQ